MDTISQIALGAAVGEAVLGKKMGNKAPMWGAVFGIVPDLDILASPFVNEVQELAIHRGISHSLLFCLLAAPLLGWLMSRFKKKDKISWQKWTTVIFLVFVTHIFIDLCTSYGTQLLQPFSDRPFSLNSIFIIDPFYTLPLLVGLISAMVKPQHTTARRWANNVGLAISSLYLVAGLGIKAHVNSVFERGFEAEQIAPQQYMTTPAPLSIFLWTGYAIDGDSLHAGLYSVFDDDQQIQFHSMAQNKEMIIPFKEQEPVERIIWFSRGYYTVEKDSANMLLYDIRFGRSDLWMSTEPASYIRKYQLEFNNDSTQVVGFEEEFAGFDNQTDLLINLVNRTLGKKRIIDQ